MRCLWVCLSLIETRLRTFTGRRSTAFQPVSGGVFAPSNLRIMRFSMQDCDGQWLDGSTLRLAFVLANVGTTTLTPNTKSPANNEAAELFSKNYKEYVQRVKEIVEHSLLDDE